jgi:hypothetical protein
MRLCFRGILANIFWTTGELKGLPVLFQAQPDRLSGHRFSNLGPCLRYLSPNFSIDRLCTPLTFALVDFSYYLY